MTFDGFDGESNHIFLGFFIVGGLLSVLSVR